LTAEDDEGLEKHYAMLSVAGAQGSGDTGRSHGPVACEMGRSQRGRRAGLEDMGAPWHEQGGLGGYRSLMIFRYVQDRL
jgi:hypothetical protein